MGGLLPAEDSSAVPAAVAPSAQVDSGLRNGAAAPVPETAPSVSAAGASGAVDAVSQSASAADPAAADSPSRPVRSAFFDAASHARLWIVACAGLALDLWSKHWAFQRLGQDSPPIVVIPNVLEFQTIFNPGALFGIGPGQTGFFIVASILALCLVIWLFAQNPPHRWPLQIALGAILAGALGNMYDRVNIKLVRVPVRTASGLEYRYFETVRVDSESATLREHPAARDAAREIELRGDDLAHLDNAVGYVRDFISVPTRAAWVRTICFWSRGDKVWPWIFNVADALLVCGVGTLGVCFWIDRGHEKRARAHALVEQGAIAG